MPQASSGWSRLACATIASYVARSSLNTWTSLGGAGSAAVAGPGCGRPDGVLRPSWRGPSRDRADQGLLQEGQPLVGGVHEGGRVVVGELGEPDDVLLVL